MRSKFPIIIGLLFLWSAAGLAASTYYIPESAVRKLRNIERQRPEWFKLQKLGETRHGRDILMGILTDFQQGPYDAKPAVMLIGGFDGRDPLGPHLLTTLADTWSAAADSGATVAALLKTATIYFYFDGNPDGRPTGSAGAAAIGNLTPHDDDHDQLTDEDGPSDVNGDGLITQMRRTDPSGACQLSPLDSRVVVPIGAALQATHRYWSHEAMDHDRDGLIGEDPPGGVYGGANFAIHWDEVFQFRTGRYPFCEPETKALVDFMLEHRNTAFAVLLTPNGGLLEVPPAHSQSDQINPADSILFAAMADALETKPASAHKRIKQQGSPIDWLYFNWGIPTVQFGIWSAPKLPDSLKKVADSLDASSEERELYAWWQLSDDHPEWQATVPWTSFDHPNLGPVEIGGFVAPYPLAPPLLALDSVITPWPSRLLALTDLLPHVEITYLQATSIQPDIYRVTAMIANRSPFPASSAQQVKARFGRPNTVNITLTSGEVIAGQPQVVIGALRQADPPATVEWLIRTEPTTKFTITVTTDRAGVAAVQQGVTP